MISPQLLVLINVVLVVVEIVLALIVANISSKYRRAMGDIKRQYRYKLVILRTIMLMLGLAFSAALFNLFVV